jgi:hypothetical protein
MTLKDFEKELRSELNKWFAEKGFVVFEKLGFVYFKEQEGFVDYVIIRVGGKAHLHELYASVSMGRKIDSIEKYWEEYTEQLEVRTVLQLTLNVDPLNEKGASKIAITVKDDDPEAVAKARDFITHNFEHTLSPEVEALTDIKALDRVYNDVPDSTRYGAIEKWYKKMIIAKLAGSKNYEKVLNLFITIHNDAIRVDPDNKAEYEKLIVVANELDKKLEKVLPLSDPKAIV